MNSDIEKEFAENIALMQSSVRVLAGDVSRVIRVITDAFQNNHTLFVCGNGGSAADAQHLAAEFVVKFLEKRKPLPAIALTTNTSVLTATGNDFSFDQIFARQVEALGKAGDVLIAISTSGASPNVLRAVDVARIKKMHTIALTGKGGALKESVDIAISVPSESTPRIQEVHALIGHIVSGAVERELFQIGSAPHIQ